MIKQRPQREWAGTDTKTEEEKARDAQKLQRIFRMIWATELLETYDHSGLLQRIRAIIEDREEPGEIP